MTLWPILGLIESEIDIHGDGECCSRGHWIPYWITLREAGVHGGELDGNVMFTGDILIPGWAIPSENGGGVPP